MNSPFTTGPWEDFVVDAVRLQLLRMGVRRAHAAMGSDESRVSGKMAQPSGCGFSPEVHEV